MVAFIDAGNATDGGFTVTQSGDASLFTAERLKDFRAVVFLGNIGAPLSAEQEAAFEAYYKDGGGLLARVADGTLDPTPVITHRMPLAEAAEAYRLFDERAATKVVLTA